MQKWSCRADSRAQFREVEDVLQLQTITRDGSCMCWSGPKTHETATCRTWAVTCDPEPHVAQPTPSLWGPVQQKPLLPSRHWLTDLFKDLIPHSDSISAALDPTDYSCYTQQLAKTGPSLSLNRAWDGRGWSPLVKGILHNSISSLKVLLDSSENM